MKKLIVFVAALFFLAANSVNASAEEAHGNLKVEGLCGMCKTRIEKAAKSVKGVSSAAWDKATKQLHLHYDAEKTSVETVSKAIAKTGHDTEKDKAPDKVYNALPDCCKYRKK
ncbi:MAG: heavy-metal-associated domain-containing protein [Tannerellaceae bacterium]|jgi:Cu(I)/Ag(I) efflux system membrane fusion protein|nr:heavy-metal-associated domain-containing protein [Tannerellaceae bacterium]